MRRLVLVLLMCGFEACAQSPAVVAPAKTATNPDRSITFRLTYPGAKSVRVSSDASLQQLPMTVDEHGLWSVTTAPLVPELYGYTFVVDGVRMLDPLNGEVHANFTDLYSDILVPGTPPAPWELTDIPHGDVTTHRFTTHIGIHYPENQTAYVVYTPPGYDAKRKVGYPVLYLLHGYTDSEEGWTETGRANLMLDWMLAEGKIVPMIVVMPRGYGDFDVVRNGTVPNPMSGTNIGHFVDTLTKEVVPSVERDYNVAKGREHRAVAGLSMGGLEAVAAGLVYPEMFAWVGGMSSALPGKDFDTRFGAVDAGKANLRLLWIACGTDDSLIRQNRAFAAWAKIKGYPVTAVETPGAHVFPVWRDDLLALAPLLFR